MSWTTNVLALYDYLLIEYKEKLVKADPLIKEEVAILNFKIEKKTPAAPKYELGFNGIDQKLFCDLKDNSYSFEWKFIH